MDNIQTKKEKSLSVVAGGCVSIVLIIITWQILTIKPCFASRFFPSIKEIGQNFVILQVDNGVHLLPWETYKAEFLHEKLSITLLWVDEQTATFLYYEKFTSLGEALPQRTWHTLCKKKIGADESTFQSPKKAIWLRPEDLVGWKVNEFIEIPNWTSGYPFNSTESWFILSQVDRVSSSLTVPYELSIGVEVYENEKIALEDFERFSKWNYGRGVLPDKVELSSQFFNQHVAYSREDWGSIGRYIGQYHNYIFILNLDHPDYRTIPNEQREDDLQTLILLLEEKVASSH